MNDKAIASIAISVASVAVAFFTKDGGYAAGIACIGLFIVWALS